jgi:large repetitive protein
LSVQSKQFGVINISLQSLAGFNDTMSMGCLGLPSGASCTFSTTQVNLAAGGTQTVQVTLDTADPLTAGGQAKLEMTNSSMTMACGLPVGVLFGLLLWSARRRISKDGRKVIGGLVMLALTLVTIGLSGCGAMQINGVAPGTYNVQVFATGTKTGITQSATITLTVTP